MNEYQDNAYVPHVATDFGYAETATDVSRGECVAFLTRDNTPGVLEIKPDQATRGVKILYKLIANTAPHAIPPSAEINPRSRLEKQLLAALEKHLAANTTDPEPDGEFIDYTGLSVDVAPDLRTAKITVDDPRPRKSSPHAAIWQGVPADHWTGKFTAGDEGDGHWTVTGLDQLGALQFKLDLPQ